MPDIDYPIYDADNHFYEPEEALTTYLPDRNSTRLTSSHVVLSYAV